MIIVLLIMNIGIIKCLSATTLVALLNQCAPTMDSSAGRFHPSPRVREILTWPEESGSVYDQARHNDMFDYRATLNKAAHGSEQALARLFRYTESGSQMGEAAITHAEVLGELLKQWEDARYAKILADQRSEEITSVADSLNEFWGYSGWPRSTFPITQKLCVKSIQAEEDVHGSTQWPPLLGVYNEFQPVTPRSTAHE